MYGLFYIQAHDLDFVIGLNWSNYRTGEMCFKIYFPSMA